MVKVAVFGASGYSGGELLRLLVRHPDVTVCAAYAESSSGQRISDIHPFLSDDLGAFARYDGAMSDWDFAFLALPHGESMKLAPSLVQAGKKVVDLSGDHRLHDAASFARYYKMEFSPNRRDDAVYGMPEWWGSEIAHAQLVANPGCYATSAILPIAPLVRERLIKLDTIAISSMSGVSGAGRKASVDLNFSEVNESIKAYKVGTHQHTPEIEQTLSALAGVSVQVTFTPHLAPITRGIYTTTTMRMESGAAEKVADALHAAYDAAPFVRVSDDRVPEIRRVVRTNFVDIGYHVDAERGVVVVLSALDNLVKGAAGQAIQNMNLQCGFLETTGLVV